MRIDPRPSALSSWTNIDGALDSSRVVLQADAREGFITAAQERAAAQVRPAFVRTRTRPRRNTATRRSSAPAVPRSVRRRSPADWQVRTTFVPNCRTAASAAVDNGLRRFGNQDLQAELVAIDSGAGDVLRWWADVTSGRRSSIARGARATQPGSAFKPFLFAPLSRAAIRR